MFEQPPTFDARIGRGESEKENQDMYAAQLESIPEEKLSSGAQSLRDSLLALQGEKSAMSTLTKLDLIFSKGDALPGSLLLIPEGIDTNRIVALQEQIADYRQLLGETIAMSERQAEIARSISEEIASLEEAEPLKEAA